MSGGTDPFHVCPCFLPVNLSFIAAFAALKVSLWRRMSADATGNFILTGDNALPLTAFALAFSPVSPLSGNDGKTKKKDGKTTPSLRKTLARAFSPVNPLSVAAFAALKVSFPGACPGKDGFITFLRMNPEFTP